MDPAVQADLMPPRGGDGRQLLGMEQGGDARHEERGRKMVAVEQGQDARDGRPGRILALGQKAGRELAVAERTGFSVEIKRQGYGQAGALGPGHGSEVLPGADQVDSGPNSFNIPAPGLIFFFCLSGQRAAGQDEDHRDNDDERFFVHTSPPSYR